MTAASGPGAALALAGARETVTHAQVRPASAAPTFAAHPRVLPGSSVARGLRLRHQTEATMSILAWVILGLIAGFIASKLVNKTGEGVFLDIILGVVGAVVGGFIFNAFGATGVSGLNIWSMIVAVIGAVIVLAIKHALVDRGHVHT
jgi:uncharacterized membrane protein YeaQ/YmgE (transglycosylase-associated protein family)